MKDVDSFKSQTPLRWRLPSLFLCPGNSNIKQRKLVPIWLLMRLLPFLIGRAAVRERDPLLLRVALAAGLASLLTNKTYLGWPRQPWDPMLLGVVLAGAALDYYSYPDRMLEFFLLRVSVERSTSASLQTFAAGCLPTNRDWPKGSPSDTA